MTTDTDQEKARALIHAVLPPETVNYAVLCWIIDRVSAGFAAGRAEERKRCAKVAKSWVGRRLDGPCDDPAIAAAFGRGVDMAAHYIAAALIKEPDHAD